MLTRSFCFLKQLMCQGMCFQDRAEDFDYDPRSEEAIPIAPIHPGLIVWGAF